MMTIMTIKPANYAYWVCLFVFLWASSVIAAESRAVANEESRFRIFVNDAEVGQEQFSITHSGGDLKSNSTLEFKTTGLRRQHVRIETQLVADKNFLPKSYHVRTDADGNKSAISATFAPGQATFEFLANGSPRKSGIIVGDRFWVLDTNVFHHFLFIAQQFDLNQIDKTQSFEVVIPQELNVGVLKVRWAGSETVSINGKSRNLNRLVADTGAAQIHLWIDEKKILHKIAFPAKRIEAVRKS
jgi:hypothetical protein